MARIKLLVDTDIFIDYLKGIKTAKALFSYKEVEIYYSILTRKELLSKPGLRDSERRRIIRLLRGLKSIKIDKDIAEKFSFLLDRYGNEPVKASDFIIAATAWSKNLPLLTRNTRHFDYIEEIRLSPAYKE
ncbi:MAG: PIN domain-containing protein [Thermodesulfobacteriota bacterium]